jgi:SOS-response transcriptional repressor LexA
MRPAVRPLRLFSGETAAEIERFQADTDVAGRQFPIAEDARLPAGAYALVVESEEMNPRVPVAGECSLAPGDVVIVDPGSAVRPGQIAVLKVAGDDRPALRKARLKTAGRIEFVALSADFGPLDGEQVAVLGTVIAHIRYL